VPHPCDGCAGRVTDTARICRRCTSKLRTNLEDVPALLADLDITRTRRDKIGPGGPKAGETPVAWNERAADLVPRLTAAVDTLAYGALTIGRPALIPTTPANRAVWAAGRLNDLRQWERVADGAATLTERIRDARAVTDRPDMRSRFVVGPCPLPGPADERHCPGSVWAHVPYDGEAILECRMDDAHRWTTDRWLRAGRMIAGRAAQLAQASA
jgi:hypothetical protein